MSEFIYDHEAARKKREAEQNARKKVESWLKDSGVDYFGTSAPRVGGLILLKIAVPSRNGLVGAIRSMADEELVCYKGLGEKGLKALRAFAIKGVKSPKAEGSSIDKNSNAIPDKSLAVLTLEWNKKLESRLNYLSDEFIKLKTAVENMKKPKKKWWQ